MNTASLELCKELEQLSGWVGTYWVWREHLPAPLSKLLTRAEMEYDNERFSGNRPEQTRFREENRFYSAYDLGYLMRRLPELRLETWHDGHVVIKHYTANGVPEKLERLGRVVKAEADTPEDAACKLAIELFKQGILKKEPHTPPQVDKGEA